MPRTNLRDVTDIGTVTPEDIDSIGNEHGKEFSKPKGSNEVKTSQLRTFYSAVSSIRFQFQEKPEFSPSIERSLILLKPKLAYAVGRHKTLRGFRSFMMQAIDGVVNSNDKHKALTNFFDLLEAVVAYHKFYGGKDN